MATYRVKAAVGFSAGTVLFLSEGQVAARRHVLDPLGGKKYRVTDRVEFKAGEVIGIEGEPDRVAATRLEAIDRAARGVKAKPAAVPTAPTPGDTASLAIG